MMDYVWSHRQHRHQALILCSRIKEVGLSAELAVMFNLMRKGDIVRRMECRRWSCHATLQRGKSGRRLSAVQLQQG